MDQRSVTVQCNIHVVIGLLHADRIGINTCQTQHKPLLSRWSTEKFHAESRNT